MVGAGRVWQQSNWTNFKKGEKQLKITNKRKKPYN
jgi:hypothetical protein